MDEIKIDNIDNELPNLDQENSGTTKKKKDFRFYDIENASSTFQKIINRYHRRKKKSKNKAKNIAAFIERAKIAAEKFETENEYMLKELRRDIKIDQELVALFGQRAKKHYSEFSNKRFKLKVNKLDFFTPKEIIKLRDEKKNIRSIKINKTESFPELTQIIFKKDKVSFFPSKLSKSRKKFFSTTFNKNFNIHSTPLNTTKTFYKTSSNIKNFKTNYNMHNNNYRIKSNDNFINIIDNNKNKTFHNTILKSEINATTRTDTNFRNRIKISNDLNLTNVKNKTENRFHIKRIDCLNKLANIKKQFINTKKEFKSFFRNNDYGCGYSKLEYRYLTKKFFI
jgi:hypothetical protein